MKIDHEKRWEQKISFQIWRLKSSKISHEKVWKIWIGLSFLKNSEILVWSVNREGFFYWVPILTKDIYWTKFFQTSSDSQVRQVPVIRGWNLGIINGLWPDSWPLPTQSSCPSSKSAHIVRLDCTWQTSKVRKRKFKHFWRGCLWFIFN